MRHSLLEQLYRDHMNMATVVDLIARELDAVERGRPVDLELLEDALIYITAHPDACHHPTEDVVFERVASVVPGAGDDVDALRREHEQLIATARDILDSVRAVEEEALVRRADFLARGRAYVELLRAHMDKEETGLFELAAEHLDAEDWRSIGAAVAAMEDPLFGPAVSADHRRLWQRISAHSASRSSLPD